MNNKGDFVVVGFVLLLFIFCLFVCFFVVLFCFLFVWVFSVLFCLFVCFLFLFLFFAFVVVGVFFLVERRLISSYLIREGLFISLLEFWCLDCLLQCASKLSLVNKRLI